MTSWEHGSYTAVSVVMSLNLLKMGREKRLADTFYSNPDPVSLGSNICWPLLRNMSEYSALIGRLEMAGT